MNDKGWIPREQTRGQEAEGLCDCPNFLDKDNRDANPPSLFLAIDFLRQQYEKITEDQENNAKNGFESAG